MGGGCARGGGLPPLPDPPGGLDGFLPKTMRTTYLKHIQATSLKLLSKKPEFANKPTSLESKSSISTCAGKFGCYVLLSFFHSLPPPRNFSRLYPLNLPCIKYYALTTLQTGSMLPREGAGHTSDGEHVIQNLMELPGCCHARVRFEHVLCYTHSGLKITCSMAMHCSYKKT